MNKIKSITLNFENGNSITIDFKVMKAFCKMFDGIGEENENR